MQELAKEDNHELEGALGFPLFTDGDTRLGWLMNLNAVQYADLNNLYICLHLALLPEGNVTKDLKSLSLSFQYLCTQ